MADLGQHMGVLARGPGHQPVAVPVRQHQRGEDVAVAVGELEGVLAVHPLALQAGIERLVIGAQMRGLGGAHHLDLGHRVGEAGGGQLLGHVAVAAHDQRPAEAAALPGHGGAQDARVVALGEDHPRLAAPGAGVDRLHHRRRGVHALAQRLLIGLHVDDRAAGDAGVHPGLGDGGRDDVDQPRVEGRRDDVVAPEGQLAAIGHRHLVGHVLAREPRQRLGAGDLHLVVDRAGMDVQRPAEEIGEPQHVVDLVGIIRPPGGHDGVLADGVGFLGGDLGVGVGHGEDDRVRGHRAHHLGRHRPLGRDAQEHVAADHRIGQRPRLGHRGVGGFPLVHALGAALVDHALGVGHDAVLGPRPHRLDQLEAGDPRRARAVEHDLAVLDPLARDFQRVDQPRRTDHRGAVLVVMEDGDVHQLLEAAFDDEALGRLDVLEVDAAEGGAHQPHGLDDLFGVFGVEFDVDGVDVGEALEEHRLALHHRLRGERAEVAEPEDRRAVRDDGHQVALGGVVIGGLGAGRDRLDRDGDAGGIGQRQVALGRHGRRGHHVELSRPRLEVIGERLLGRDAGARAAVAFGHGGPP